MRSVLPAVIVLFCLLALSAACADHPYSADGSSNIRSYYNQRQSQESPGVVRSPRPVRYSSRERRHSYDYRYECHPYSYWYDDALRYRPRVRVYEYYYPRTLFPYGIRPFGYDSIGTRPPICVEQPYLYDCRPGYRRGFYGRPGAVLRYGNGSTGLTIIIRP